MTEQEKETKIVTKEKSTITTTITTEPKPEHEIKLHTYLIYPLPSIYLNYLQWSVMYKLLIPPKKEEKTKKEEKKKHHKEKK